MAEQLAIDWRPPFLVEARCGCATSGRDVCEHCGDCGDHCRCVRPAPSSAVRKGVPSRTPALARALRDTLATWHVTRH